MRILFLQILLVISTVLGNTVSYYVSDCQKAEHFQIEEGNFTHHDVSSPDRYMCANMTIRNRTIKYSSAMMQFHAFDAPLNDSLYNSYNLQYSIAGHHAGLVYLVESTQTEVNGFVKLGDAVNKATDALFLFNLLNSSVPVPGACNQENNLENDPNLKVNHQVANVLVNVTFAEANVGFYGSPPKCEASPPDHDRLRYDFYLRYLPWGAYSKKAQFAELQKMMTVEGVEANGKKIHTFGKNDKPELRLAMFNGRGVILNIVVWDSQTHFKSVYVPNVTYTCGSNGGSVCHGRVEPILAVVYALGLLVGGALCFVGHRYFLAELFFFGLLPFTLLSFMILAANTSLSQPIMLFIALLIGVPGGLIWLALWYRFGYVLPVMMWVSLTLGYLLSSIIFFTPFGNLNVWYNSLAYGMAFMCGVMLVPVILIVFTKLLSMVACAVWGSYLVVAAISYYSGGVLHYIMLNIIHRASIPGYSEAFVVVPMEPVDIFLIVVWFVMIVAGVATQRRLTRGRRDFPICAYKERKLVQNQRKALARQRQREGMPPAGDHRLANPVGGAGAPDDDVNDNANMDIKVDDHRPLIVN